MLKVEKFKKGEVAAFRLSTSDEIIGEVVDVDDTTVSIKKPCTLAMGQNGSIGLTPAALLGDPEAPIVYSKSHILAVMKPRQDAEKSYTQFASGIQLATPGQTKTIVTK